MVAAIESKVDFPQPFFPIMAAICPVSTTKLTPLSTGAAPYFLLTCSTASSLNHFTFRAAPDKHMPARLCFMNF